jgi:hypothetical protein
MRMYFQKWYDGDNCDLKKRVVVQHRLGPGYVGRRMGYVGVQHRIRRGVRRDARVGWQGARRRMPCAVE